MRKKKTITPKGISQTKLTSQNYVNKSTLTEKQQKLLNYLSIHKDINKNKYAKDNNIPRTTVYNLLTKLENEELIKDNDNEYIVTNKGELFVEKIQEVKAERVKVQKETLSTHFIWYRMKITDRTAFSIERLKELNPISIDSNKLPNRTQWYVKFDGVTCIVDSKKFSIRINDVVEDSTEEQHFKIFSKAIDYVDKFNNIGLKVENLSLEDSHWAIVNSVLGEVLEKKLDKFFITLSSGEVLYLDHSKPNEREIETDSDLVRDRVERGVELLADGTVDLEDIDKLKNMTSDLIHVCASQIKQHEMLSQNIESLTSKIGKVIKVNENTASGVQAITKFLQVTQLREMQNQYPQGKPDYFG